MDFTNKWRQLLKYKYLGFVLDLTDGLLLVRWWWWVGGRPIRQLLPSVNSSHKMK